MTDNPLERAAEAIAAVGTPEQDVLTPSAKACYVCQKAAIEVDCAAQARAALEAIREPGEKTLDHVLESLDWDCPPILPKAAITDIWKAMIDAMLETEDDA